MNTDGHQHRIQTDGYTIIKSLLSADNIMALAVPPQRAGEYSERVQELLGYSIVDPGFMGFVDRRHPKHLINPDYRGRKHHNDLPGS